MKTTLTFLLAISCAALYAQPTVTSSIEPAAGTAVTNIYADSSTMSPGNAGANQTWDFSGAVASGIVRTDDWINPAGTPFDTAFVGVSICQKTQDTANNDLYLYLNRTSAMTDLVGMGFEFAGSSMVMHYTDPLTYRTYPLNYNGTLYDNYDGTASISIGPFTVTNYRYGWYSYVIDGWGTLITPLATYTDVLRMHIRQYNTDSIVYAGGIVPTQVVHTASTAYFWGTAEPGHVLYQAYMGYDTTITDSGSSVAISASYQGLGSGVPENNAGIVSSLSVYPSPASDKVTVTVNDPVNGDAVLRLYDIQGREIWSATAGMHAGSPFRQSISLTGLSPGLYTIKVFCNQRQWTGGVVKE